MCKVFVVLFTILSAVFLPSSRPVRAEDFTLSDEGLMALQKGTYYGGATPTLVSRTDIPGPGVEFEIYYPGIRQTDRTIELVCSGHEANAPVIGANVGRFDHFTLKFTLLSVNGRSTPESAGMLCVGALIGCVEESSGQRPEAIGFAKGLEPNAVSSTIFSGEILNRVGFTAYMPDSNGWDANGSTVKLLVEPGADAVVLPQASLRIPVQQSGRCIYVDISANGSNNGSSWRDAFKYLQDALDAAVSGDQIWVAEGIYRPDQGKRTRPPKINETFALKNGVALYGGFPQGGGRWEDGNPATRQTVLSGDLNADDIEPVNPADPCSRQLRTDNCIHVVTASGTDETAVLDGFIITGGNARGSNLWTQSLPTQGAGLYCKSGSPTINNCLFKLNAAENGGAAYCLRGTPKLTNCKFLDNFADDSGGAIHSAESNLTILNCVFSKNHAAEKGGAIYSESCKPTIINCTVTNNDAYAGGGIYNHKSVPTLANCILWGNTSRYGSGEPSQIFGVKINSTHCCIQGLTKDLGGTANIDTDPLLVGIESDGYHLRSNSPCIDRGDSKAIPDDVGTDIDNNPRIAGSAVDIGAVEIR